MSGKKRLVIDASVTRSAGDKPIPGFVSAQCRAVLEVILKTRHSVAFSLEGWAEWHSHRSRLANRWLVRMFSRKLVIQLGDVRDEDLRERLQRCVSDREWRIFEKDCHLVETAFQVDRIVISRDETVRRMFHKACTGVAELRQVLWANPEIGEERVAAWLGSGAKIEKARGLG